MSDDTREFATIKPVKQLELEGFSNNLVDVEDANDGKPLTYQEVREREAAARLALKDKLDDLADKNSLPSWAETFNRLLAEKVPWKIAAYVAWASMPKQWRVPRSQDEFAREVLGLTSDRRISEWRKKNTNIDILIASFQSDDFLQDRADVLFANKEVAKTLNYKGNRDREIFLTMTGDLVKTTKLEAALRKRGLSKNDVENMTDQELDETADVLLARMASRKKDEEE